MITREEIQSKTVFVVKMQGWRDVGTWEQIKHLAQDEDCRDCDICAKQPTPELQDFWNAHDEAMRKGGFIKAEDFYRNNYSKREG